TAIETAAELSQLGLYVARVDSAPPKIVYSSPRACTITGRPLEQLVGALPWSILRESDWPMVMQAVSRPAGAPPLAFDVMIVQPSGKQVPIEIASTRIITPGGTFVFGFFRDVSIEREALAALRASEA